MKYPVRRLVDLCVSKTALLPPAPRALVRVGLLFAAFLVAWGFSWVMLMVTMFCSTLTTLAISHFLPASTITEAASSTRITVWVLFGSLMAWAFAGAWVLKWLFGRLIGPKGGKDAGPV